MKWALMDKKEVVEMGARLDQNKISLLLGLTSFGVYVAILSIPAYETTVSNIS